MCNMILLMGLIDFQDPAWARVSAAVMCGKQDAKAQSPGKDGVFRGWPLCKDLVIVQRHVTALQLICNRLRTTLMLSTIIHWEPGYSLPQHTQAQAQTLRYVDFTHGLPIAQVKFAAAAAPCSSH